MRFSKAAFFSAKEHGIPPVLRDISNGHSTAPLESSDNSRDAIIVTSRSPSKSWLFRNLLSKKSSSRTASSLDGRKPLTSRFTLSKSSSSRTASSSDGRKPLTSRLTINGLAVFGKGRKHALEGLELKDVMQLGGTATFTLPEEFCPAKLIIPAGLCATATQLAYYGMYLFNSL